MMLPLGLHQNIRRLIPAIYRAINPLLDNPLLEGAITEKFQVAIIDAF